MDKSSLYDSHGWLLAAGALCAAIGFWRAPLAPLAAAQGSGGSNNQQQSQTQTLPPIAMAATADSNNRMIAVTGTDITGASILYVIDSVSYQLAVYQAVGGSESSQGIKLIGARRIDLDFRVDGYKDRSQFSYKKLLEEFDKQARETAGKPGANSNLSADPGN